MSIYSQIQKEYNKGHKLGYEQIKRYAISAMRQYPQIGHFCMAMGTYSFYDKNGEVLNKYTRHIDNLCAEWDDTFNFTGHPLRINRVQNGELEIIYDW